MPLPYQQSIKSVINASDEVLIRCEHVSKKFCRTLKRSLFYAVLDLAGELNPLRKNGSNPQNQTFAHNNQLCNASRQQLSNQQLVPPLRKDEFWAVKDVSFELKRGECLGLIGHNGAGKSTLLKMLNGIIKPDQGRIEIRGRVGALIELGAGFNPILTGRENIYNKGAVLGFMKKEIDKKFDAIVDFAEIGDFLDMPIQNYSSGMKVRLGFAVSAQMEPDVLIIDEVLAVGDVGFRAKCYDAIGKICRRASVIFVSHSMPMVNRICSKVFVMDKGETSFKGAPAEATEKYFDIFPLIFSKDNLMNCRDISLREIRFESHGKYNVNSVWYGDPINIYVTIESKREFVDVIGRIVFLRKDLQPIAASDSSVSNIYLGIKPGKQTIRIDISKFLLSPATYSVSFGLRLEDRFDELLWCHSFKSIKVKGNFFCGSPHHIPAEWDTDY